MWLRSRNAPKQNKSTRERHDRERLYDVVEIQERAQTEITKTRDHHDRERLYDVIEIQERAQTEKKKKAPPPFPAVPWHRCPFPRCQFYWWKHHDRERLYDVVEIQERAQTEKKMA